MGTNRYYYTDPLAAAWMAKHFGMRFDNLADVISGLDGDSTMLALPKFVNDCRRQRHFRIHPDSLHLLEPKIGDIMQNPDDDLARVVSDEKILCRRAAEVRLRIAREFVGTAATIIQRDGKPFFWPESEAA